MKKALSLILGTFCAVFPVSAEDLFHAGGLGTDIWNARLEAEKTSGKNYLSNGDFSQGSGDFSNSQDMKWGRIYSRKALGKAIPQDLLKVIRIDLNGKKAAHFINEEGLSAFQDAKGNPVLANVIAQYVKVEKGGNYILSFRASGFHSKKAGQHIAMTSVACFEGPHQKGKTKPTQYNFFTFSQSEKSYQVKVPVPEKTRNILISITLRGIGEMKISDLEFREAATTGEPKPILWTLGFLDNRFCIGENLPASMQFLFHWPKDVKAAAPRLNIRLPKGFRIAAPSIFLDDLRNEGNNVWSCAIHGRSINALTPLAALQLRSDLPASEKRYKAEFWITNSGKKYTVHSMELQVIPEFRGIQPKNFLYGTMNPWLDNYKGAAAVDQANLYRQTGFNIMSARGKDQYEACLKAGMTIQGTAPYHDGYEMGLSFKKPENVIFRRIDGTPQKAMSFRFQNYAICPTEVINRGEFYRNCVWKTIENRLNQIDLMGSIWFANWEPQYTKNGCWCERCREEFIKYTKLPAADVRKYWPREIQDKYEPQWVKFRKWQAGRMIVNLERDTRAIAKKHGKNVDFQIELCRDSMLESLCKDYYLYDPGEYLSEVKRMGAWGPYLFFDIRNPNDYNNAFYMRSFLTTKGVQAYIDKRLKPGATRPLISGLIHNTQGVHWLAPPSAFAFESYSYFLNKWAGVRGYFFPHGADHRYFSGAARASADFARTEDFVWKGKERKNITAVPVTPFPENQMKGAFDRQVPDIGDYALIQVKAWEKDGKLAVFVGNFWQMGECFFRLKVPGLQANKKYFVSLASQRADFCAENKQGFTGAELAKGVLLHVGALRWNAYIIRESAEKGFAKVTPSRVVKAMNDKKQTIKTAYANEMKHLQKMNARKADDKKPDYSELKGLENGKVKCTIKNGVYSFETPVQKIQVELAKGGRINSWKVYGREIVMNTGKFSAAMECGLEPTDFLSSNPVKFVSLKKHGKDALVLTLSRRLSHSDGKSMVGVQLYKRYTFHPEGVDLSVKVNNSTPNSMKLNFRWHNMFIFPEIKFQGYNNSNWFKRTRDLRVYRLRGKHHLKQYRALEKAITGSVAQMRDPAENWIFTITPNPSVLFSAYIMWDGSGAASTLEPMFDEILLNEGQSADYEIKFRIKKK